MLTPNFLENFPQPLTDLYQELESFIIQDIARRLRKAGTVTSTAEYQKIQAELFSMNNITQKVSENYVIVLNVLISCVIIGKGRC
jgi:hypothetical protein